jgi:hypothetical protein
LDRRSVGIQQGRAMPDAPEHAMAVIREFIGPR